MEFGVVMERGEAKAYGAGLLSSFGEIDTFRNAELRTWNFREMGQLSYDITHYQPILFRASSLSELASELGTFFREFSDDVYFERYAQGHRHPLAG
jgi:phenylalanine-4-hydroxylase